jgi:5-carboxymethyl-2-hydroxymuconate isomerase
MPHLVLEYSSDLEPLPDLRQVFDEIHAILVDVAGARIANVKSRAVPVEAFVGDGDPRRAFAHLEVRLMEGRSTEVKAEVSSSCLEVLVAAFGEASTNRDLQVTVHVTDLDRATYAKHPPRTIPQARPGTGR